MLQVTMLKKVASKADRYSLQELCKASDFVWSEVWCLKENDKQIFRLEFHG